MWEIEILFLNLLKRWRIFFVTSILSSTWKVFEISFSNSRLFPHADDPLLQKKYRLSSCNINLSVGVGRHIGLHLLVRGAAVTIHLTAEVLANAEGLGHAVCRWLNVVVRCGGVHRRVPVPLQLLMPHQCSSLSKHTNHIFSFLCLYFLSTSQF